MSVNNKVFSSKQEHLIPDYLSWKVVSGSGARHTLPGDVCSDEWLGECKTHTTPCHTIIFQLSHWKKIEAEATAKFLQPALFVDSGRQTVEDTWVLFKNTFDAITVSSEYIKIHNSSLSLTPRALDPNTIYSVGSTGLSVASLQCFKSHVYVGD